MKKHFSFLCIATLIAMMALVGCCPTDDDKHDTTGKIASLQSLIDNASAGDTINLNNYNISNYNATVNKALTINAADKNFGNANVTVTSNGVTLNNLQNSNVTASASLGNGSLKIASSSLSTLTINGGGMHTVEIPGVKVNTIIVDKGQNVLAENVRLLVDELTQIKNSLDVQSSLLIDWNGSVDPNTLFGDKGNEAITLDKEDVNLAFRKSSIEMKTPNGKAKANFNTGDVDKSFYVFVNEGGKLNEAMVKQTANVICGGIGDINKEGSSPINYEETISGEITFTTELRDTRPFIVTNTTSNQISIMDASSCGLLVELQVESSYDIDIKKSLFNQAMDKNGNIYCRLGISGGSSIMQIKKDNQGYGLSPSYPNPDTAIYTNYQYSRLDVYDKGNQKIFAEVCILDNASSVIKFYEDGFSIHIYKEDDEQPSGELSLNTLCYEREETSSTGAVRSVFNVSFAQAVAFDNDGNIYVAICDCCVKDICNQSNTGSSSYNYTITDNNSRVVKYPLTINKKNDGSKFQYIIGAPTTICSYKDLEINIDQDVKCESGFEEIKIYKVITERTVCGIQDMKVVGNELVICTSKKLLNRKYGFDEFEDEDDIIENNKVIIYNLNNKQKYNITANNDKVNFVGPCRIAYADKDVIAIYDNGYNIDKKADGGSSLVNKNQIIFLGKDNKDNNKWICNKVQNVDNPLLDRVN